MKITLSWLKDFLDTSASVEVIAHTLSMTGLEVESITNPADKLKGFKIAHILETEQHPNADRLKVCKVDTGHSVLQVVCGAANARSGLKVVFAPEGTCIPAHGVTLKKTKIRDVESSGMMCSAAELELGEDSNGIIELPDDAPVGISYASYAGLDDPVFDIGVTPNRGDCLGVYGIARDLAAAGLGVLKHPTFPLIPTSNKASISVAIDENAKDSCSIFMGRVIKNVKNCSSPDWMQQRLKAIGLRPKSALVDITNYLQFAYGRPMHVFDLDKVQGNIHIRMALDAEKLQALNEEDYVLDNSMTVVADDKSILSIAGIIGSEASACHDKTTNVFIESAVFDPKHIALTGRKLNILTDSRYRFERGVDHGMVEKCLDAATQFILDYCGGQASDVTSAGSTDRQMPTITFNPDNVKQLTGLDLPHKVIAAILTNLGFGLDQKTTPWEVAVPSWRNDCTIAADLVEEVTRIHGYNNIEVLKPTLPEHPNHFESYTGQNMRHRWSWAARRLLASRGYNEAMTWSFLPADQAEAFGGSKPELKLINPINAELTDMRPSLLPNLLTAAQRNFDKGYPNTSLFEVGSQFHSQDIQGQITAVTGVRTGLKQGRHWQTQLAEVDVYTAKQDAQAVLSICDVKVDALQVVQESPAYYHPGRSGKICLGPKNTLAYFGELHPHIAKQLGLKERAVGFEVFITNIPLPRSLKAKPLTLSPFQPVNRDFAFIVEESTQASAIVNAIQKVDKMIVQDITIFDIYQGQGVEHGHKSVAVNVMLQPQQETFTDKDLSEISQKIIHSVEKSVGGRLRA